MTHQSSRISQAISYLVVIGLAFVVRLYGLARQSIWPDEAYSVVISHWPLAQMVANIRVDNVPLYPIVLGWWQLVAGSGEFSLRYFSVLLAFLSVPLVYVVGRRLVSPAAGVTAAVLLALSPFQIYFAQEVRMYGMAGTLGLLSSWLLIRYPEDPPRRILAAQAIIYGLLGYTHYSGFYILATHATIVVVSHLLCSGEQRVRLSFDSTFPAFSWRWAFALLGGVLLITPWLYLLSGSLARSINGGTSHPLFGLVQTALVDLTFGFNRLDVSRPVEASVLRDLQLASLILVGCLVVALLPGRVGKAWITPYRQVVPTLHVLIPIGSLLVLVQFTREFATRYAFPGTVWVPILAVVGLWRLPIALRGLGMTALLGFGIWGTILYVEHPGFGRLDFRRAISEVIARERVDDAVIVSPDVVLTYQYYREQAGGRQAPIAMPADDPLDLTKTELALTGLAAQHDRLWRLRWQDYHYDSDGVVDRWLGAHAIREYSRDFDGGLGLELWLFYPPLRSTPPTDAVPRRETIGDNVQLVASQAVPGAPGEFDVTFYWLLQKPLTEDYTVFIHLLGPDGHQTAQKDGPPYDGQYPTSVWPTGKVVRDVHHVPLSPCASPGNYQIEVGFYVLKTMRRLGTGPNDTIRLPVTIDPAAQRIHLGRLLTMLPAALRLDERLPPGVVPAC